LENLPFIQILSYTKEFSKHLHKQSTLISSGLSPHSHYSVLPSGNILIDDDIDIYLCTSLFPEHIDCNQCLQGGNNGKDSEPFSRKILSRESCLSSNRGIGIIPSVFNIKAGNDDYLSDDHTLLSPKNLPESIYADVPPMGTENKQNALDTGEENFLLISQRCSEGRISLFCSPDTITIQGVSPHPPNQNSTRKSVEIAIRDLKITDPRNRNNPLENEGGEREKGSGRHRKTYSAFMAKKEAEVKESGGENCMDLKGLANSKTSIKMIDSSPKLSPARLTLNKILQTSRNFGPKNPPRIDRIFNKNRIHNYFHPNRSSTKQRQLYQNHENYQEIEDENDEDYDENFEENDDDEENNEISFSHTDENCRRSPSARRERKNEQKESKNCLKTSFEILKSSFEAAESKSREKKAMNTLSFLKSLAKNKSISSRADASKRLQQNISEILQKNTLSKPPNLGSKKDPSPNILKKVLSDNPLKKLLSPSKQLRPNSKDLNLAPPNDNFPAKKAEKDDFSAQKDKKNEESGQKSHKRVNSRSLSDRGGLSYYASPDNSAIIPQQTSQNRLDKSYYSTASHDNFHIDLYSKYFSPPPQSKSSKSIKKQENSKNSNISSILEGKNSKNIDFGGVIERIVKKGKK